MSPQQAERLRNELVAIISNASLEVTVRRDALALLGHVPESRDVLSEWLSREEDQTIRIAAIGALARQPGAEQWQALLDGFPSDTPAVRRAIIDGVLANMDRTKLLLNAIEAGKIKAMSWISYRPSGCGKAGM